jgi:hypothetical protein
VAVDDRRIDFVLGAVAVDRGSRRLGDDRAGALAHGPPDQPVDEGIFERGKRNAPVPGMPEQPVGVVAAGVGDRQRDRKPPARRVDDWGRERTHGQLSQIRTDTKKLQRIARSIASGKTQMFSA